MVKEQKSQKQKEQCSDPGPCNISILSRRRVGPLLVGLNMFHLESKRLHLHITPWKKPGHLQPSTYTQESHQGLVCARVAPNWNINYRVLNHIADAQTSSVSSGPPAELSFASQLKDCTVLWNSAQPLQSTRAALVYTPPHAVQYMFTCYFTVVLSQNWHGNGQPHWLAWLAMEKQRFL